MFFFKSHFFSLKKAGTYCIIYRIILPTERMVTMAEELKQNESMNFIHTFVTEDIAEGGRFAGQTVHTRFPPVQTFSFICYLVVVRSIVVERTRYSFEIVCKKD